MSLYVFNIRLKLILQQINPLISRIFLFRTFETVEYNPVLTKWMEL